MFTAAETHTLLTDPMRHAPLRRQCLEGLRFPEEFWGPDGIARVHQEAGGWPHLVQLVAESVVDEVNAAGRRAVDGDLFERALDRAVGRGLNVLYQLVRQECRTDEEWQYLAGFKLKDVQPAPSEAVLGSLRHRLLVVPDGEAWRLRVPLMQRWIRSRE